jgi:hypothetical protein
LPCLHRGYCKRGGTRIHWNLTYIHHEWSLLGLGQKLHRFVKAPMISCLCFRARIQHII